MAQENQDVHTDPLFVGLTRPAVVFGIHYYAFVAEVLIAAIIFLAVGNPFYLLLVLPIHGVLYLVSNNDPGKFGALAIWSKTIARSQNTAFWGAASFSPLPSKKWKK